jgi:hypothetical protein
MGVWHFPDRRFTNWTNVRSFGEIEVLRRTSVFTLAFVPLMAALWPALSSQIDRLADPDFVGHLPTFWALAFLASLGAFLGQTVYQMGAPVIVRERSLEAFVAARLTEFDANRSPAAAQDGVRAADEAFERATGRTLGAPETVPSSWPSLTSAALRLDFAQRAAPSPELQREVVEASGRVEYLSSGMIAPMRAHLAHGLYLVAAGITMWIIATQTYAVLRAAEIA